MGLDNLDMDLMRKSERIGDVGLYFLELFKFLLYEHYDDLPRIDVRKLPLEDSRRDKFKCQGNFICGLKINAQDLIIDKIVKNKDMKKLCENFYSYNFNFSNGKFTSPEEINFINSTLEDFVLYLQSGHLWKLSDYTTI